MLKVIWVILKIGLLVCGAVWLAYRPGFVDIHWDMGEATYDVSIQVGFFLFVLFLALVLAVGLTRFALYFKVMFQRHLMRKQEKSVSKGLDALTLSVSSAAAGDHEYSLYHAQRAEKLLPGKQPLPILLHAHALRTKGQNNEADALLEDLLNNSEGAVLAARALVTHSLAQNNLTNALYYTRHAHEQYKGRDKGWLLKTLYELEVRQKNWVEAEKLLKKLEKKKIVTFDQAMSDRLAIWTAQAYADIDHSLRLLKSVLRKDPAYIPAVLKLADLYIGQGHHAKAKKVIERCWKTSPHPELGQIWMRLRLVSPRQKPVLEWVEKLTKNNPAHLESYLLRIQAMIYEEKWGDAQQILAEAVEIKPEQRVYKLWADLDERAEKSEATVRMRMEQMLEASPAPCWICKVSGLVYPEWKAIALPHQSFNTIIWSYKEDVHSADQMALAGVAKQDASFDMLIASS